MLEVHEIKKERYFIEFTSLMVYFLDLQSAFTEMTSVCKLNLHSILVNYTVLKK